MAVVRRVSMLLDQWPAIDRLAWENALAARRGRFGRRGVAAQLRDRSLAHYRESYGAWLSFLQGADALDPGVPPEQRLTPERLNGFVEAMWARGNRDSSVESRLVGLWRALTILAPNADLRWILRPGGRHLSEVLDTAPRPKRPRSARNLFDWGMRLLHSAEEHPSAFKRAVQLRDGLIIALLAGRGLRVGELASLTLGRSVFRPQGGTHWRNEIRPENRKAGGVVSHRWSEVVEPFLEHYLRVARPLLLKGHQSDALWISWRSRPMAVEGLQGVIQRRSATKFGAAGRMGPHAFRHALTTSTVLEAPGHVGIAPDILGHSSEASEKYYDWAGSVMAATAYGEVLDDLARRAKSGASSLLDTVSCSSDDDDEEAS
jgi:integrase